ncbi:hypothetical protein HYV71_01950 [Candidatus Uhrbacteria bacterium]|nr:hypothetical protein [Candidatus Uhrbacteria bacterium]
MRISTNGIAAFQIFISLMLGFLFLNPAHAGMHHTCPITLVSGITCPDRESAPLVLAHYFGGLKVFLSIFVSEIFTLAILLVFAFVSARLIRHLRISRGLFLLRIWLLHSLIFFERARFLYWIVINRHKQKAARLIGCMAGMV